MSEQPNRRHPPLDADPQPIAVAPKPNSRMSTTSLVFGILAILGFVPGAVLAIIVGIMALNRIDRSPGGYGGRRAAMAGVICGSTGLFLVPVFVAIVSSILLPGHLRERELAHRQVCRANLKKIGAAMLAYVSNSPESRMPELNFLVQSGMISRKDTICPSAPVEACTYRRVRPMLSANGEYAYTPILLIEPLVNHQGEGRHILFKDGSVGFFEPSHYTRWGYGPPSSGF